MTNKELKAILDTGYYSHIPSKFRKEFMTKTTIELLEILEKMTTRSYVEETYGKYVQDEQDDYRHFTLIRYEVLFRLGLIDMGDTIAFVQHMFNEVDEKLKEFMKEHKNHRHRGLLGTYTEKPVY
ncbi:unnamed protein product [marine sediment metagenome]|uniref:Uncharacterized protein n=1 Tax=marine sediment metagenome TaxID=412755 RepID=X1FTE9_9ZZZZ